MECIPREMEPLIEGVADEYAALLVTGPRQVGKSTLLGHVAQTRGSLSIRLRSTILRRASWL